MTKSLASATVGEREGHLLVKHPGGQLANPLGHLHTRHVRATAERDLMIMSVT